MNGVMTGMALVMVFWMRVDARAADPLHGDFWLMMSASLIAEAIVAYPFNWWLVARKLKHGRMSTAVKGASQGQHMASHGMHESRHDDGSATPQGHMSTPMPGGRDHASHRDRSPVVWASAASFVLTLGVSYGIMR